MSHHYSGPDWGFPKSVQILELTFNSKEESNGRTQIRRKRIQTFSRPFRGTVERGSFPRIPGHLQFLKDSIAGRTPNVQSVGISYMYGGFWVPNKSHAMGSGNEFHVGPHIMIIGLDQKMMQTLNHDGSNGEPYVNHLPGRSELYLVIPIREWEDSQAVSTIGATR